MRRLVRCVCLLILLAEASGCKSVRQSTASQRAQWEGEVERELTAVVDSVLRYELEGSSRWEWTQLDCSLDTVRPDAPNCPSLAGDPPHPHGLGSGPS